MMSIRKSHYTFELINNKLRVFPIPQEEIRLWFEYILVSERDNQLIEDKERP